MQTNLGGMIVLLYNLFTIICTKVVVTLGPVSNLCVAIENSY